MYYVFMPTEQGAFVAVSANAPQNIRIGDKMVEYVDPEKYRIPLLILVGFGRACAPVRCAHPSFWAHCHAQRALRATSHRSFAAPAKIKRSTNSGNKMLPFRLHCT